ncbi:MAG: FKBP-type peptidyl-prolyl cis-trans isomerase [Bacteroidaceae bacterium]|nr:FKBP-type peptidyl-prolyl cis-trans isomerase [Bacteroidaceae bacterium]
MKKLMLAATCIAAIVCTSCTNTNVKAELKDNVDSLTNYLGIAQAEGLKSYMQLQLQVDSLYQDEFIRGMIEGATSKDDPKQMAYRKGIEIGQQIKDMTDNLSAEVYKGDSTKKVPVKNFLAGIIAGLRGEAGMTTDSAYNEFQKLLTPIQEANSLAEWGEQKKANEDFLAENAKKEGVVVLPSGVQYKVLTEGAGPMPTDTTKVKCLYEGRLIDGTVFDSMQDAKNPFEVNLAMPRVIPGWVEVLKLMPAGSKWEVYIPQEQGYGKQDMGQIKPYSTLIFTIETLK